MHHVVISLKLESGFTTAGLPHRQLDLLRAPAPPPQTVVPAKQALDTATGFDDHLIQQ
jgi:hypothetical protein